MVSLLSGLFISCNKDNTVTEYSGLTNDAQIYSFSLSAPFLKQGDSTSRAQDSLRILKVNTTKYSIDQLSRVVYNPDSLPYLTNLKNVKIVTSVNSTYGVSKIQVVNKDTVYDWNSSDSIDFSKAPIDMIVHSWGGTQRRYKIEIRTHKIDPDLMVWDKMSSLSAVGKSKSFFNNDTIVTYILTSNGVILNKSLKSNIIWKQSSISGLPKNMKIESFSLSNGVYNAVDDLGLSYVSKNGATWTKVNNGYTVKSVVGVMPAISTSSNNDLLVLVEVGGTLYFAKGSNLATISQVQTVDGLLVNSVPSTFPVSSMSAYTNNISSNTDKMLVVAGGNLLNNSVATYRWLIKNTNQGIQITSFTQTPVFTTSPGLSIFAYNNAFYILNSKKLYTSENKGETWVAASAKQSLDANMSAQSEQSVLVDNNNYIWVIGGKTSQNVYSTEVWRGRLNSLIP